MLYVEVGFRYHHDCTPSAPHYLVWSIDAAALELREVIKNQLDVVGVNAVDRDQLFTDDALITSANLVTSADDIHMVDVATKAMDYSGHADKNVEITISRDGKSAWASELATVTLLEQNKSAKEASDGSWSLVHMHFAV